MDHLGVPPFQETSKCWGNVEEIHGNPSQVRVNTCKCFGRTRKIVGCWLLSTEKKTWLDRLWVKITKDLSATNRIWIWITNEEPQSASVAPDLWHLLILWTQGHVLSFSTAWSFFSEFEKIESHLMFMEDTTIGFPTTARTPRILPARHSSADGSGSFGEIGLCKCGERHDLDAGPRNHWPVASVRPPTEAFHGSVFFVPGCIDSEVTSMGLWIPWDWYLVLVEFKLGKLNQRNKECTTIGLWWTCKKQRHLGMHPGFLGRFG